MKKPKSVSFRGSKSNPGIRLAYQRTLDAYLREMQKDVGSAVLKEFRAVKWRIRPEAAEDGFPWRSPLERLADLVDRVAARWVSRFATLSDFLAGRFVRRVLRGVQNSRRSALKDAGLVVRLTPSRLTDERVKALIEANVNLIKSIPVKHLERVKKQVLEAAAGGMDEAGLARALKESYGITERRAKLIARDQTLKATQALAQVTDVELGVTEGVWRHVPGRKSSRPSHVRMHGKRFILEKGLWDEDERKWVTPGSLPLCACVYAPIFPER